MQHCHIDTLSITGELHHRALSMLLVDPQEAARIQATALLENYLEGDWHLGTQEKRRNMYQHGFDIIGGSGTQAYLGYVSLGGNVSKAGNDTFQVYLSSLGCHVLRDWKGLRDRVEYYGYRISRVDVAVDDMQGRFHVDRAAKWLKAGLFDPAGRGRPVTCTQAGDWITPRGRAKGRTLYIGSRQSHKFLRVYEKGKQLGDPDSPWVRWEVEFKRDRLDIPLDILTDPGAYFVGAYPCLHRILQAGCTSFKSRQAQVKTTVEALTGHLRRSYGKLIWMLDGLGMDVVALATAGIKQEPPRRVLAEVPPLVTRGEIPA